MQEVEAMSKRLLCYCKTVFGAENSKKIKFFKPFGLDPPPLTSGHGTTSQFPLDPASPESKISPNKKIKSIAHYLMNFNKGEDESLFIMPAFDTSDAAQELLKTSFAPAHPLKEEYLHNYITQALRAAPTW